MCAFCMIVQKINKIQLFLLLRENVV